MLTRSLAQRTLRLTSTASLRNLTTLRTRQRHLILSQYQSTQPTFRFASTEPTSQARHPVNSPAGDAVVEEITELYATAYDEFEIATESTDANATYAQEDRNAAREELEKLLEVYQKVTSGDSTLGGGGGGGVGEEVRRRVGPRIRELEQGVKALEERALEQD